MPEVCLLGDVCTGHGGFPSRANVQGDDYLTVNGRPVHCVGHAWATHCDSTPSCHSSALAGGSDYLSVNGNQVGRVGDPVACGSSVATGDSYLMVED